MLMLESPLSGGVCQGYIGRLGRIGNTPAYRFDNVPQYKAREFEAACKSWSCPECGDTNQANRRYDSTGLAVCDNCKSAFEPGLIGEWIK